MSSPYAPSQIATCHNIVSIKKNIRQLEVGKAPSTSTLFVYSSLTNMGWLSTPVQPRGSLPPASSEEVDEIVAVIHGFLTAMSTKSRVDFEKHCVRAGGMSLSPPAPTLPRFCTIGSFVEHITAVDADIDERIWDPEVMAIESGNLAAVWAPFRAKINGVVDHVGVELFVLHKLNGEWKVTGLADSCRRPTEEERLSLA